MGQAASRTGAPPDTPDVTRPQQRAGDGLGEEPVTAFGRGDALPTLLLVRRPCGTAPGDGAQR